jgi:hypothetical protein
MAKKAPPIRPALHPDLVVPTWLNLVFKSGADFGEGVAEVVG